MPTKRSTKTPARKFVDKEEYDPMVASYVLNIGAELLGKKWRAVVLFHLNDGPKRFSELKRRIPGVSVKVLTEVLKEMEANKLITRTQYNTIPVKVLYDIHPQARGLMQATLVASICFAEHALENTKYLDISPSLEQDIRAWIKEHHRPISPTG